MLRKNDLSKNGRRFFRLPFAFGLLGILALAGCSAPKETPSPAANAAPASLGSGSTSRDQNLKNMPDDVRARLQAQGQPVK